MDKFFEIVQHNGNENPVLHCLLPQIVSDKLAWEVSLEKWKLIYTLNMSGILVEDGGPQTCGLCKMYFYGHADECEECPILLAGYPGCDGTPYRDYQKAVLFHDLDLATRSSKQELFFLWRMYMGIDFSYLLFFRKEHLENALQGLVSIADPGNSLTTIHFPDHDLAIPLLAWANDEKSFQFDEPEIDLALSLLFETDAELDDYVHARGFEDNYRDLEDRSPPDDEEDVIQVSIGTIYLTIYTDLQKRLDLEAKSDFILFDFGTTGTNMSLLFDNSSSIRKKFIELLENNHGVCGIFNREMDGEIIWFKGQPMATFIDDPYTPPDQIEQILQKR